MTKYYLLMKKYGSDGGKVYKTTLTQLKNQILNQRSDELPHTFKIN
jgi:hypothetical protein